MGIDMVEVPDEMVASWLIDMAREWGGWGDVFDTAYEGPHGEHEFETDWSLADLDPADCHVDRFDNELVLTGELQAHYSVKVSNAVYNPPSKAHPADYRDEEITLMVEIVFDMNGLPEPVINAEPI